MALSTLFTSYAQAGTLYDQCLVFVVDSSTSAQPGGWQGQVRGIAAGLVDAEVRRKVRDMHTGIRAGFVAFSSTAREMEGAHLRDDASLFTYASYVSDMRAPVSGNNNLLGALDAARAIFQRIAAEGHECLYKTIDFSGDGADATTPHTVIQEKVAGLAREGVTINGLSFYDLRFGKYRTMGSSAWNRGDRDTFAHIHDYYRRVVVTQPGTPGSYVRPGQHFTIDNQMDINTEGSIVEQLTELMRRKVRYEVASREDLDRIRHARMQGAAVQMAGLRR